MTHRRSIAGYVLGSALGLLVLLVGCGSNDPSPSSGESAAQSGAGEAITKGMSPWGECYIHCCNGWVIDTGWVQETTCWNDNYVCSGHGGYHDTTFDEHNGAGPQEISYCRNQAWCCAA